MNDDPEIEEIKFDMEQSQLALTAILKATDSFSPIDVLAAVLAVTAGFAVLVGADPDFLHQRLDDAMTGIVAKAEAKLKAERDATIH